MKKIALGFGALALMGAPVVAQSLPATAPVLAESELGGEGGATPIVIALGIGIVVLAVIGISDDNDGDDLPVSA